MRNRLDEMLTLLLRHVEPVDGGHDTACWRLTLGRDSRNGYRRLWVDGREIMGHRFLYETLAGPIAPGLVLDHLCRQRWCVRPCHHEPVTIRENTLRGEAVLFRRLLR